MIKPKITKKTEQMLFEEARELIEIGLGINLSLAELTELRWIWTPKIIGEWKRINPEGYDAFNIADDLAMQFSYANYSLSINSLYSVFVDRQGIKDNTFEQDLVRKRQQERHYFL